MILYHYPTSPFSRRVRLVLASKGLDVELRDARADAAHGAEVRRLNPLRTVPVLVDGERVVCESGAIAEYLDRKVPEPPLWPRGVDGAEAYELVALADGALSTLVDLGTRFHALHETAAYPQLREEFVGRAQRALDALAARVAALAPNGGPLFEQRSTYADMVIATAVLWLEALPARAPTFAPARQILELGWTVPPRLHDWAAKERERPELRALG